MSSFRERMLQKTAELGVGAERPAKNQSTPLETRRSSAFKTGPGMLGALAAAEQRIQQLEATSNKLMLPVAAIQPNPWQPRKVFTDDGLASLAESIREVGLVEPIVVRRFEGGYQLIAGERRLRAHRLLNLEEIKAAVSDCSDEDMAVLSLVENVGREDLTDYEIGQSLRVAESEFPSRKRMAEALGMSRKGLYRFLAFEKLPDFIRRDLDLNPRVLGGTAADEVVSVIRRHGNAGIEAARALWSSVLDGALDQGKFAPAISRHVLKGSSQKGAHEGDIEKIFSGKIRVGTITRNSASFTIKIKTGALTADQEKEIRNLIASLFNVAPS